MLKKQYHLTLMSLVMATSLFVSACATSSAAPRPAEAPEKTRVVMAIGGSECLCYLPTTLAYQLGYFQQEGLTVDLQDVKGGSKSLEALVAGSADVVSGYYEHTIRMQTKQKQIQSFVNFAKYPGLVLVVSKRAAGRVRSVKDLKGANVGVSAPGSATHAFLNYLLNKEGLSPADVGVIGIGLGSTAVAALEKGSVDAAVLLDPAVTQLQNRKAIEILVDTRTEEGTKQVFGTGYAAGALYTTTDFVTQNPVTTQRLTNAIVKALRFIESHSAEEVAAKMPESYFTGDKELYVAALRAALPGYSPDGSMPEGVPANTLDVLALSDDAVRNARSRINLQATYTNRFIRQVPKP